MPILLAFMGSYNPGAQAQPLEKSKREQEERETSKRHTPSNPKERMIRQFGLTADESSRPKALNLWVSSASIISQRDSNATSLGQDKRERLMISEQEFSAMSQEASECIYESAQSKIDVCFMWTYAVERTRSGNV
ncbi:hypothetical protein PROFUN_01787 [Planoprotostelium fungivorum]|uniref:Uncharacterized protein n=1 Tax=Planoprotostelium fungivorum TaxID=1890364 RepID=A0A2P6MWJ0_9EUKA|nr:hypothetical protein PROFUN_01787 [Planoprotostelium fungivorum]